MNLKGQTSDVKTLYEKYPYPSDAISDELIYDLTGIVGLLLSDFDNSNGRVLDLGCGTGHRLAALAEQNPNVEFVGIDMTERSINIAKRLMDINKLSNVSLCCSKIEDLSFTNEFDIVVSTGVFHHMEQPHVGFDIAFKAIKENGLALIWLYHEIGEYYRLTDHKLVQLFSQNVSKDNFSFDINLLKMLNKSISKEQYGNSTAQLNSEITKKQIIDADALLHPIVNAYDFESFSRLFENAGFHRTILGGLNRPGESKVIDISGENQMPFLLDIKTLFGKYPELLKVYKSFSYRDKIRAIELAWRPTGICCLGLKTAKSRSKLNSFVTP